MFTIFIMCFSYHPYECNVYNIINNADTGCREFQIPLENKDISFQTDME